jgi:hypothetical protein
MTKYEIIPLVYGTIIFGIILVAAVVVGVSEARNTPRDRHERHT